MASFSVVQFKHHEPPILSTLCQTESPFGLNMFLDPFTSLTFLDLF